MAFRTSLIALAALLLVTVMASLSAAVPGEDAGEVLSQPAGLSSATDRPFRG
ncbi:hypothetical protein N8I71_06290 [Roseibacterium sp. SDUM158016]|jgi:hypothetical protein|uniref:hypothetical protein n=1 Tax=Roseicyclus sediminis TaxID=2980997 RepID=UPI0021D14149|nr:hypothetical protein [Roseibacterium sp. SDUM158016]MCU4652432.1 hypothetical protein [Roseibacterium sp. SDUM158016]